MKPTIEQVQKFWEQCGFKYEVNIFANTESRARYPKPGVWRKITFPDGKHEYDVKVIPFVTLDNLERYAVPVVKKLGRGVRLSTEADTNWGCEITPTPTTYSQYAEDGRAALAMFWAIYKVFEEGNRIN